MIGFYIDILGFYPEEYGIFIDFGILICYYVN